MFRNPLLLVIFSILISASPCGAAEPLESKSTNWFDRSHQALSLRTRNAVLWFDRFFADENIDEAPASIRIRLTSGWKTGRHRDHDGFFRVRVKTKLPSLKERFYFELGNEDNDSRPLDNKRLRIEEAPGENDYSAALSWLKQTTVKETLGARLGIRGGTDLYLLGYQRRFHNLSHKIKLRLTDEAFIDKGYGFGGRLIAEFLYVADDSSSLRFCSMGQLATEVEGREWRSELAYTYRLNQEEVLVGGFYLRGGFGGGRSQVDHYLFSLRLRKHLYHHFMFYEIEPFLDWPKSDRYRTDPGISLSLQLLIGD